MVHRSEDGPSTFSFGLADRPVKRRFGHKKMPDLAFLKAFVVGE
jgi:hypothetical protein